MFIDDCGFGLTCFIKRVSRYKSCKTHIRYTLKDKLQSNMSLWSPLLSSHLYLEVLFSCLVIEIVIWIEPLLRGHLFYQATFLCPKVDLLIQVLMKTLDFNQNTWRIGHEAYNNEQNDVLKRYLRCTCMLYSEGSYNNSKRTCIP